MGLFLAISQVFCQEPMLSHLRQGYWYYNTGPQHRQGRLISSNTRLLKTEQQLSLEKSAELVPASTQLLRLQSKLESRADTREHEVKGNEKETKEQVDSTRSSASSEEPILATNELEESFAQVQELNKSTPSAEKFIKNGTTQTTLFNFCYIYSMTLLLLLFCNP